MTGVSLNDDAFRDDTFSCDTLNCDALSCLSSTGPAAHSISVTIIIIMNNVVTVDVMVSCCSRMPRVKTTLYYAVLDVPCIDCYP